MVDKGLRLRTEGRQDSLQSGKAEHFLPCALKGCIITCDTSKRIYTHTRRVITSRSINITFQFLEDTFPMRWIFDQLSYVVGCLQSAFDRFWLLHCITGGQTNWMAITVGINCSSACTARFGTTHCTGPIITLASQLGQRYIHSAEGCPWQLWLVCQPQ